MDIWNLVEISWKDTDGLAVIVNSVYIGRQTVSLEREEPVSQASQINMFIGRSFEESAGQKFGSFCVATVAVIQTTYETAVRGELIEPSIYQSISSLPHIQTYTFHSPAKQEFILYNYYLCCRRHMHRFVHKTLKLQYLYLHTPHSDYLVFLHYIIPI